MKIGKLLVTVLVLGGLAGAYAPPLSAEMQMKPGEKMPADSKKDEAAPKTYPDAVKNIQSLMKSIDTAVKAGKLKDTHPDAEAIIEVSKLLGEFALADKSGVPKDKVKDVNKASKDLVEATDGFHDAADAGKADEAKTHYAEMVKLVDSLSQYLPKEPMDKMPGM